MRLQMSSGPIIVNRGQSHHTSAGKWCRGKSRSKSPSRHHRGQMVTKTKWIRRTRMSICRCRMRLIRTRMTHQCNPIQASRAILRIGIYFSSFRRVEGSSNTTAVNWVEKIKECRVSIDRSIKHYRRNTNTHTILTTRKHSIKPWSRLGSQICTTWVWDHRLRCMRKWCRRIIRRIIMAVKTHRAQCST